MTTLQPCHASTLSTLRGAVLDYTKTSMLFVLTKLLADIKKYPAYNAHDCWLQKHRISNTTLLLKELRHKQ